MIYIIVITYNGAEDIADFLKTYRECTPPTAHLVVVDNGSADETLEIVRREYPSADILCLPTNTGYAGGARRGMEYALKRGAEYIAVVNQDIRFTALWLEPLVDALARNERCAAVQPKILLYPDTTKINSFGNATHYLGFGYTLGYKKTAGRSELGAKPHVDSQKTTDGRDDMVYPCENGKELSSFSGAAVLFRSAALKNVGLIDEFFFMYYEDTDLSWRLRLAGYALLLCCASTVHHRYEFSRSMTKFYYMERNRLIMLIKNYSVRALFLIAPMGIVMEAGMVAYSACMTVLRRRDSLTLLEKLRSYLFFLMPRTWIYLHAARREAQKHRRVKDAAIVKLFCDTIEFQDIDNPLLRYVANPLMRAYWSVIRIII
ncbi:glycosyltransferase family 2 protein [Candidatus Uhrbacteria bacterium]|nr:glycosyltransferase family 2 protein [Candidatus Uhrbacteria bacterium]